jgi:hypothetical protein
MAGDWVIVYRYEKKDGTGPYSGGACSTTSYNLYDPDQHPNPNWELIRKKLIKHNSYENDIKFGFESIEQMNAWFPLEFQQTLKNNGYTANTYYVPAHSVVHVEKHIAFIKKNAVKIGDNMVTIDHEIVNKNKTKFEQLVLDLQPPKRYISCIVNSAKQYFFGKDKQSC